MWSGEKHMSQTLKPWGSTFLRDLSLNVQSHAVALYWVNGAEMELHFLGFPAKWSHVSIGNKVNFAPDLEGGSEVAATLFLSCASSRGSQALWQLPPSSPIWSCPWWARTCTGTWTSSALLLCFFKSQPKCTSAPQWRTPAFPVGHPMWHQGWKWWGRHQFQFIPTGSSSPPGFQFVPAFILNYLSDHSEFRFDNRHERNRLHCLAAPAPTILCGHHSLIIPSSISLRDFSGQALARIVPTVIDRHTSLLCIRSGTDYFPSLRGWSEERLNSFCLLWFPWEILVEKGHRWWKSQ